MVRPCLFPWMEKSDDLFRRGVDAGEIWPFVEVAVVASQSEILQLIIASMLAGDDMLDVKNKERIRILMNPTVFAAIPRTLSHKIPRQRVHESSSLSIFETTAGAGLKNRDKTPEANKGLVFIAFIGGEPPLGITVGEPFDAGLHLLTRTQSHKSLCTRTIEAFPDCSEDIFRSALRWWRDLVHESERSFSEVNCKSNSGLRTSRKF